MIEKWNKRDYAIELWKILFKFLLRFLSFNRIIYFHENTVQNCLISSWHRLLIAQEPQFMKSNEISDRYCKLDAVSARVNIKIFYLQILQASKHCSFRKPKSHSYSDLVFSWKNQSICNWNPWVFLFLFIAFHYFKCASVRYLKKNQIKWNVCTPSSSAWNTIKLKTQKNCNEQQ